MSEQSVKQKAMRDAAEALRPHFPGGVAVLGLGDANDNGVPDVTAGGSLPLIGSVPTVTVDAPIEEGIAAFKGIASLLGPGAAALADNLAERVKLAAKG